MASVVCDQEPTASALPVAKNVIEKVNELNIKLQFKFQTNRK